MQPQYPAPLLVNNISPQLRARRDAWAEEQGIKPNEMLVFRKIGNGSSNRLNIKSVLKDAQYLPFEEVKATNESYCPPNDESIIDKDSPGGFARIQFHPGGYFPGKEKQPVVFKGNAEETVKTVVPEEDPFAYDFLTLSPRLKGGVTAGRITPQFELLRPDMETEANWEDDQKQAEVILKIGTATLDTLKWMAPKLFLPTEVVSEQRMRKNFSDYAKISPANVAKLDNLFNADETRMYQQVEKAIAADVVSANADKAMWVMTHNQEAITPASPDRNTLDQLVGFLMLEPGQVTFKQIIQLTAKAEQTTGPRKPGRPSSQA